MANDYSALREACAAAVTRLDALPLTAAPYGERPRHDPQAVDAFRRRLRAELRPLASSYWPVLSPSLTALRDARRDVAFHGRLARLRNTLVYIARGERAGAFDSEIDA